MEQSRILKEHAELKKRLGQWPRNQVSYINDFMKRSDIFKRQMNELSNQILRDFPGLTKPDRLAQRQRLAFVVWFLEHLAFSWPYVLSRVNHVPIQELQGQQHVPEPEWGIDEEWDDDWNIN
jgi:hypothetical protein